MPKKEEIKMLKPAELDAIKAVQKKDGFEIVEFLGYDLQADGTWNFATKAKVFVEEFDKKGNVISRTPQIVNYKFNAKPTKTRQK